MKLNAIVRAKAVGVGTGVLYRLLIISVILGCVLSSATGRIHFPCSPNDAFVTQGSSAVFCCVYNGTNHLPLLRINSLIYGPTSLPDHHYYTREGLLVENIRSSMNGSTYSCLQVDYNSAGNLFTVESCVAVLTVMENSTEIRDCCSERKCTTPPLTPSPTPLFGFNSTMRTVPNIILLVIMLTVVEIQVIMWEYQ